MRKIFHIRIDSPSYSSDAMRKAFEDLGFSYDYIDWQAYRFNHGIDALRDEIISMASRVKPEFIFAHIQNPEILRMEDWEQLNSIAKTINYTFDVRVPEEMEWMYEVAKRIHHTVFSCYEDVGNCARLGIQNTSHSFSSCDMELFKPQNRGTYAFDVVFCGNRYDNSSLNFPMAEERQRMIEFLDRHYGNRFMSYGLGQRGGLIQPAVESNVYSFSKIAISQNNFNLSGYSSDRIWRIMASGTMCLSKYFSGIEKAFEKEVHLDWWRNFDELKSLIDFYLGDDAMRTKIAKVGSDYVRNSYTWKNALEKIFLCM